MINPVHSVNYSPGHNKLNKFFSELHHPLHKYSSGPRTIKLTSQTFLYYQQPEPHESPPLAHSYPNRIDFINPY